MTDDELDLVETEVLVETLARRYRSGVVLIGTADATRSSTDTHVWFRGGPTISFGLLKYAEICIADNVRRNLERDRGDEE